MWNHFEIVAYWTKEIKLNLLVCLFSVKMWLSSNLIDKILKYKKNIGLDLFIVFQKRERERGGGGRGEREWKLDKYEKAKGVQNLLFSEFPWHNW